MRRLVWFFGWVAVAIWSLFAFAAYGLVDVFGQAAMRNADIFSSDPETVEWIWRVFSWAHGASVSIILVVWGCVSLAILCVPWLFDRFAAKPAGPRPSSSPRRGDRPRRHRLQHPEPGPGARHIGSEDRAAGLTPRPSVRARRRREPRMRPGAP